jgi:hypothetical protein
MEFDVARVRLPNGITLLDRLGVSKDVRVTLGKLRVSLPGRSVAIFVRR